MKDKQKSSCKENLQGTSGAEQKEPTREKINMNVDEGQDRRLF